MNNDRKFKLAVIIAVLLIVSLACSLGQSTPTPDLDATLAVSLQQTVAAQPTSTPTEPPPPTSTPTEVPSPTPTTEPSPTPEPAATEEEKAYTVTDLEGGWKNYLYHGFGFSISLPPRWAVLDLTADDLEAMLSGASEMNPEIGAVFTSDYLKTMIAAGIRLIAVDTSVDSLTSGINTNLNVLVLDLPFDMTLDDYVEINVQQIHSMLGEDIVITQERIFMGDVEAEKLEYGTQMNDAYGNSQDVMFRQFLMLQDRTQFVLTITATQENFLSNTQLFDEIAASFVLVE